MVDLDQYDLAFSATIITMEWFQATKRRVGAETGVDHVARTHTYHHSHHFLAWWLQWPLRRLRLRLRIAKQRQRSMRRVALAIATALSARSVLTRCDNAIELPEFYSSCDIVRQPLGRQK